MKVLLLGSLVILLIILFILLIKLLCKNDGFKSPRGPSNMNVYNNYAKNNPYIKWGKNNYTGMWGYPKSYYINPDYDGPTIYSNTENTPGCGYGNYRYNCLRPKRQKCNYLPFRSTCNPRIEYPGHDYRYDGNPYPRISFINLTDNNWFPKE